MEVKREIDDLGGIYDIAEWDEKAKEVLDKIFDEEKEDEAMEVLEYEFGGDIPDEWDIAEFVRNNLLREMKNR